MESKGIPVPMRIIRGCAVLHFHWLAMLIFLLYPTRFHPLDICGYVTTNTNAKIHPVLDKRFLLRTAISSEANHHRISTGRRVCNTQRYNDVNLPCRALRASKTAASPFTVSLFLLFEGSVYTGKEKRGINHLHMQIGNVYTTTRPETTVLNG